MSEVNRGSEWGKWNFHVHTKGTNKNDQFVSTSLDDFFYTFFKKAYENQVNAIGITDYFSIDRYRDAINYVTEIETKIDKSTQIRLFNEDEIKFIKSIFLFPNVELRITPTTKKGKFINLHFLFDPKIIGQIDNEFFNKLSNVEGYLMNYDSICQYAKYIQSNLHLDQLYKYGIDNYNVEFGKIKTLLETNKLLKNNSIIAISSKSNDGVSGLKDYYDEFENEGGSLLGTIKSIYKISRIIFSNAPSDKEYFLGKKTSAEEVINHTGSLKPCVIGCDSHDEKTLFNRFTWVKANRTFEGLKQIIFEPEERVKIQAEMPESEKLDNLMIEKVSFISSDNRFTSEPIYFNKNLNVIIGGKSSGKSILLYEIAKTLYANTKDEVLRFKDIEDNNQEKDLYNLREISKNKIDENYNFCVELFSQSKLNRKEREIKSSILPSIKYIPQNHLSNLVDKSRKNGATLKKLIRDLILEDPEYKLKYDDFIGQAKRNDEERSQDIDFYFSLKSDLDKKEKELLTKGDTKALNEGISFNKQKIEQLNKDFSDEELSKYENLMIV